MSIQNANHTGRSDGSDGFRSRWCGTRIYRRMREVIGTE